jgi:glycosyltransferase involved in cell wall biosynthesis
MSSGRTIVATDIAPHRWALEYPKAGILAPPTAQGLAEAIRKTKDSELRRELSKNALKKATDQFCHIKKSRHIYSVLTEMLKIK